MPWLRNAVWSSVLVLACACKTQVIEAYCNACGTSGYSEEECRRWGEEASCQHAEFIAEAPGDCINGCRFEDCDRSPECRAPGPTAADDAGEPDADSPSEPDPACAAADTLGLFLECNACGKCVTLRYNDLTRYACSCGDSCPCDFTCGSVDLPGGTTIGDVCVPP